MPRVFDNINEKLLTALQETLDVSYRADFCVGYFNLRGWKQLASHVEPWPAQEKCCRLLVGMLRPPHDELRAEMSLVKGADELDNQTALRLKKRMAELFREQLTFGVPTDADEAGLRQLARQLRTGKLVTKLFLKHSLHAKLYLMFRDDKINPMVGYLGSSNLTLPGLSHQGELNVDVLDLDACRKLSLWFEDRWNDKWCMDISKELAAIIDESWAREEPVLPYHIYVKMAYHLSQEARTGLTEFRIPRDFGEKLLEFQVAAVKIAAHHLNKRKGVIVGDVVGLGKTLMATALARIFEDDHGLETLILCPKNLVKMWEDYRDEYRLRARVMSVTSVIRELPELRRYRILILDESHNLRNREGKRYKAIQEYIQKNDSRCILLSATPYNKTYLDLSNQLRLFVPEDLDIGTRPERLIKQLGETEFIRRHQCPLKSLAAFEKSEYPDDWRDLMRLYMVRRTRSFIKENYAATDPSDGRKYLTFSDGTRSYFPTRVPKRVPFEITDGDPDDQYARLYDSKSTGIINRLELPRYGLGNYEVASPHEPPTQAEATQLQDLSRAGKRLMGFCRTNLFKRIESSGLAFQLSVERHILRNFVFLHAIENDLPIPIGTQDAELLDTRFEDEDVDITTPTISGDNENNGVTEDEHNAWEEAAFQERARRIYNIYHDRFRSRFKWLRPSLFVSDLARDLRRDSRRLISVLDRCGEWDPDKDSKLEALHKLISEDHPHEKIIVFTQFADTVRYLTDQLWATGVKRLAGVWGDTADPTTIAYRFSPVSNNRRGLISDQDELRVVISTDILSEGQNLQDCSIVVNYDLPWAIIRLIQRAGRVDRIGQLAEEILCYSFLPADGVERIINLRGRVRQRLIENAEVVGTDEAFFEGDVEEQTIVDLYNEKAGVLDGDDDTDVDLASYAYQIWKNAITRDPSLQKSIPSLPPVVYSTKSHCVSVEQPEGVLVYLRTGDDNDALAWVDKNGKSVTESQLAVLKAAECAPDAPAHARQEKHHEMVQAGVRMAFEEERFVGGQLGRPSGARFRTYERLKNYAERIRGEIFETKELARTIDEIYRYPLRQAAIDGLNRQLRSGVSDEMLAELAIGLREEGRLCKVHEETEVVEPRIICSLGLAQDNGEF